LETIVSAANGSDDSLEEEAVAVRNCDSMLVLAAACAHDADSDDTYKEPSEHPPVDAWAASLVLDDLGEDRGVPCSHSQEDSHDKQVVAAVVALLLLPLLDDKG
jgi:hypothetical protein